MTCKLQGFSSRRDALFEASHKYGLDPRAVRAYWCGRCRLWHFMNVTLSHPL